MKMFFKKIYIQRTKLKQVNNLITGNLMVAEIPAVHENHKGFIVVQAYNPKEDNNEKFKEVSIYLNDRKKDNLLFSIQKCEIEAVHRFMGYGLLYERLYLY